LIRADVLDEERHEQAAPVRSAHADDATNFAVSRFMLITVRASTARLAQSITATK
jgi:hypothetical protein